MSDSDGYQDMIVTLARAELAAPPVPDVFRSRMRGRGPWCWATRDIEPGSMYNRRPFIVELLTGEAEAYAAMSHAGHGINSYTLNYTVVHEDLALLVQSPWGGAYMDSAETAREWAQLMDRCAALIDTFQLARREDRLAAERLVVIEAGIGSVHAHAWLHPHELPDVDEWLEANNDVSSDVDAVIAATAWLRSLGDAGPADAEG